jgi:hypothetical protein
MTPEQLEFEVAMIIADKEAQGKMAQCDMLELHRSTGTPTAELLPLMRYLARTGKFVAHISINKIPILTRQ